MGAAEFVQINDRSCSTIETVRNLKQSKGYRVFALETTEKSESLFEASFFVNNTEPVAFVLGNELIGEQNHCHRYRMLSSLAGLHEPQLIQIGQAWIPRSCKSAMASSAYRLTVLRIL